MTSSNGNIFRVTGPLRGSPPVTGGIPSQRPMTRNFNVFFDLRLNKRLSKQSRRQRFQTPSRSLLRHCNVVQMVIHPHRNSCSFYDFGPILKISSKSVNTSWLWPGDAMLCYKTWSTLVLGAIRQEAITWSNIDLPSTWASGFHSMTMFIWSYSVYQYTSVMKFTRLKFVKGSHYFSGAQCTKLGSGFVACLQISWFLTPPEHQ